MNSRQGYQIFDELDNLLTSFYFRDRKNAIVYAEEVVRVPEEELLVIKLMNIPEDY